MNELYDFIGKFRRLQHEEEYNFEQDRKELGWFSPNCAANHHLPSMMVTHYIRQIILTKLHVNNYGKSNTIFAELCTQKYAEIASEQEDKM